MSNLFNTNKSAPGIIAKAAAKMLADELQFCKSVAKADEKDYDGKNGYSAGDTIYISKPARFVPQTAFDITSTIQDITEGKVPLVLDTISTVGLQVNSLEFATTIQLKSLLERVIKPAVSSIAQNVESRFLIKAVNAVANTVGTAGATVFDPDTVLSAREKINKFMAPMDDERRLLFDSTAMRSAVNARKGLFQQSDAIAKQYKTGAVGRSDGFLWLENQLVPTHTRGTATGTITVTTTSTEGDTTIALTGTGSQTLVVGDVFTISSVYAVHPITKTVYPFLMQFVVTANNTASSGTYTAVAIQTANGDAIYAGSNGLQNVSALPQSGATATLIGSASTGYTQNLVFHKNAFRMVSVPLVMPKAVEFAVQETYEGITVAIIRSFDVLQRRMITRMDFLGGLVADRPEWACKITA
jgi:coat protein Gp5